MDVAVANTPDWDESQPPLGSPEGGKRGYLEHLLPDGLHLSGTAYRVFWNLVKDEIKVPVEGTDGYVYPGWTKAPWLEK